MIEVIDEIHMVTESLHEMANYAREMADDPPQPSYFSFSSLACSLRDFLPSFTAGVTYPKLSFGFGLRLVGLPSMKCCEQTDMYFSNSFLFNASIQSLMSSFLGNLRRTKGLRQARSLCNIPACSSHSLLGVIQVLHNAFWATIDTPPTVTLRDTLLLCYITMCYTDVTLSTIPLPLLRCVIFE